MRNRIIVTFLCSALGLIGTATANAEAISRYECSNIGAPSQEPIGDRNGHNLVNIQYSCFAVDGLLKGAVFTASTIQEWDGPKGTMLYSGGTHRLAGGIAVTQLSEGIASIVMKDDKPVGIESAGKAVFKFAAGTLAALSGKPFRFVSKPMGAGRFSLDLTD